MACRVRPGRTRKPEAINTSKCLRESRLRHAASIQLSFSEESNRHTTKLTNEYLKELTGRIYYDVGGFYERSVVNFQYKELHFAHQISPAANNGNKPAQQ
jgi:hypothetical protein